MHYWGDLRKCILGNQREASSVRWFISSTSFPGSFMASTQDSVSVSTWRGCFTFGTATAGVSHQRMCGQEREGGRKGERRTLVVDCLDVVHLEEEALGELVLGRARHQQELLEEVQLALPCASLLRIRDLSGLELLHESVLVQVAQLWALRGMAVSLEKS